RSQEGLEQQRIEGHPWLGDAGLWFVPVDHVSNQNASPEEVDRIAGLVAELLRPGVAWVDAKSCRRSLALADILIMAPYNAQVASALCRYVELASTAAKHANIVSA